jgi:hypothetical protein
MLQAAVTLLVLDEPLQLQLRPPPHTTAAARCAEWLPVEPPSSRDAAGDDDDSSRQQQAPLAALLVAWPSTLLLYCWRQRSESGEHRHAAGLVSAA